MNHPPVQVNPWLYWSMFPAHQIVMRTYFRSIKVSGRENLPQDGPMMFAPKHLSRWDPLVLYFAIQKPLYFMTDVQQFQGTQAWLMRNMGAFPVNRDKPEASSIRTTMAILAQSDRLVIFPEGGIVRDQLLRPLKPGLARILLQAEALTQMDIPIIPIGLKYRPDAIPLARVWVDIGRPIWSKNCRAVGEKSIAKELTQSLDDQLRQIMGERSVLAKK